MRLHMLIVLLLTAPLLLAGCTDGGTDGGDGSGDTDGTNGNDGNTGDDNNTTGPESVTVDVGLTGAYPVSIAYDPATITVANGTEVTIRFTNNDQNPVPSHDWVLEGYEEEASTDIANNGETVEVTFTAPPTGTYLFYCSIGDHRQQGMEGTFVVE